MKSSKCVFCGKDNPAGLIVCSSCLKTGGSDNASVEVEENLQDVAAIIDMAVDTDKNLKSGLESILNIAKRLNN